MKKLYTFAASFDVHVDFVWYSTTHKWLQYADELSRIPDSSELFLRHKLFTIVCNRKHSGLAWGWPTLDVFAVAAHATSC